MRFINKINAPEINDPRICYGRRSSDDEGRVIGVVSNGGEHGIHMLWLTLKHSVMSDGQLVSEKIVSNIITHALK